MQKELNIVFTIDENYIQHFTVALTSFLENYLFFSGRIFLIHDIDDTGKLYKSLSFFKKQYGLNIEVLVLDSKILNSFKITDHISKATYFRLMLAEILPKEIDKILFLDSDIVINNKLTELINLNFCRDSNINNISSPFEYEYYIYAVNHKYDNKQLKRLKDTGFEGNKYFNAGVMYINLKKWRENGITTLLLENATKYNEYLLWWDQDVLNITFDEKWGELEFSYNAFGLTKKDYKKNYKIIHYTGSSKPWQYMNDHPYKNLYWHYLKKTPYRNYRYEDYSLINAIKKHTPKPIKKLIKTRIGIK